jgi:hypothetical protein
VDDDEPRYLGMRVGYVRHASRGMRGEGEAITALEQDQQTRDAQRAASDRDKAEWLESSPATTRDRLAVLAAIPAGRWPATRRVAAPG